MTLRDRVLAGALGVGLGLAAAGCGDGDDSSGSGPDQVKVGVIPIVDVAPIYLGEEQGFFEDEDIELSLESGQGGAAIVPGVESGQLQFGFSNNTSLLVAAAKGLGIRIVAPGNSTTGEVGKDFGAVVVPQGSDITSAKDLAGRTVAVNTLDNIGSTTINQVVSDDGGDPSAIEYVELGFPDMPGALSSGQVDAAWVVEPFLTISQSQGATPVAWNFAETDPELMIAAYFTSERLEKSDPDLVERFASAMVKSLEYAQAHPDEVREILGTYTELDPELASEITLPLFPADINESSLELLAELAVQDGILEESPDISAMLP